MNFDFTILTFNLRKNDHHDILPLDNLVFFIFLIKDFNLIYERLSKRKC